MGPLLHVSGHHGVLVHFLVWRLAELRHSKALHPWVHHAIRIWGIKWVHEHVQVVVEGHLLHVNLGNGIRVDWIGQIIDGLTQTREIC